jgi:hypothetical protein
VVEEGTQIAESPKHSWNAFSAIEESWESASNAM